VPGNSFGQLFKITTFGESHGGGVGVIIDGCPPGITIHIDEIQAELDRRKPGQSEITTPRKEEDKISIMSGVFQGTTTGTPIMLIAHNKDVKSEDYTEMSKLYRPSHADYTYKMKYGLRDWRGSGRASARETLARVAAGVFATKVVKQNCDAEIISYVEQVGSITTSINPAKVTRESVESNEVRCPDQAVATEMIKYIQNIKAEGDSVGGVIRTVVRKMPIGLGEPVFHKLHADLGWAMLGINAVKGFEIGSGFAGVSLKGSAHNDPLIVDEEGKVGFATNNAGGTLGGISSGQDLNFRVAFKPVSTISKEQKTVTAEGEEATLKAIGRHDPCVLPRAVPIVDAMTALVLADHILLQIAQGGSLVRL
jgi:chorismate synthase